ncbi:thiamine pyrophosphate-dependent dehydrogenase E1 component subunit alpha [Mycolicibacterium elephantis]|uniref:Acetoin:2,6-dichlorophenolindophenol oxidoreductase subunit alpha n=1 Tax=Mycolicibacterium elephantis DSM 44368 TaxID=1335622 RepID=A0A439DTB7_9MYCO|nr:thiamine pyrophosphate-dependent dehydrogenase E1 component subunit alpha [Mycolicibacterium elephantis]MCV7223507.1 thiamine pyrophosphate-dependent dehydrogenase E1 component subunit alpha [Mycolicibacterium elephantis]RWA19669.1 acetoin:2,6-dichlorophenolindophenol oxidoreductase subunit alpha [Mycolicibacterium elephantis DSM 44368]
MDSATRLDLYRMMRLIRTYEEAILREYHLDKKPSFNIAMGQIPGEMHLSTGQEPVPAGFCAHLRREDAITGPHRPHGWALAKGVDIDKMTAEIFGRVDGLGKGRGGHMHLFDQETHFSCSGIIAEGLPTALGIAMVFKREGAGRVALAATGDGAANQGAFHESLNLAALWNLPVVFVIEDNGWGVSVAKKQSTAIASNADRAVAYGMPGVLVKDNDVEAIYDAAGEAITRARNGGGPTLIEVETLRLWGHFEGDAQVYRPDLEGVAAADPLPAYEKRLRDSAVLSADTAAEIEAWAVEKVESAIRFAKGSPVPDPATARDYQFV